MANPLVGTWSLVAFEARDEEGRAGHPFGLDAAGLLTYTADGRMSVHLGRADRPLIDDADWFAADDSAIAAAAREFIAYCGTYELRGDEVTHQVEMSLAPDWLGTALVRTVAFDGDCVTLSTPPTPVAGRSQLARLVWRRI